MQVELDEKQIELLLVSVGVRGNELQDKVKTLHTAVESGVLVTKESRPAIEHLIKDYEAYIRLDMKLWEYLPDSEEKEHETRINSNNLSSLESFREWLSGVTYYERKEAFNDN